MLPPSLHGRYSASTLLWGNPTSPQASATRRCLLVTYRPCGPEEISWGKIEQCLAAAALSTAWTRSDIGRRVRWHTCPGQSASKGSLAFGAAIRFRLPSHTPSRERRLGAWVRLVSCSCLQLVVASDRPHRGLPPPFTQPCPAHPRYALRSAQGVPPNH